MRHFRGTFTALKWYFSGSLADVRKHAGKPSEATTEQIGCRQVAEEAVGVQIEYKRPVLYKKAKIMQKNLRMSKKSSTFATAFDERLSAISRQLSVF